MRRVPPNDVVMDAEPPYLVPQKREHAAEGNKYQKSRHRQEDNQAHGIPFQKDCNRSRAKQPARKRTNKHPQQL